MKFLSRFSKKTTEKIADITATPQSLATLTGGMAHEFNNLLAVILGNAASIRMHAETRNDKRLLQRIESLEKAAERGGRLTNQLLAFANKLVLRPELCSVYSSLTQSHEFLSQAAGDKNRVILTTEPNLQNCYLDVEQLQSSVINLILNSRDAMLNGGDITVSCKNKTIQMQNYVLVEVRDGGVGMTDEILSKVFEPFFTTKELGKGTGLGLSQVYGFAKQSGGWVDIESVVDDGTVVSMYFPGIKPSKNAPSLDDKTISAPTVLVVKNDKETRDSVRKILEEGSFNVLMADGFVAAFALLAGTRPIDVIFTQHSIDRVRGMDIIEMAKTTKPDIKGLISVPNNYKCEFHSSKTIEYLPRPYCGSDLIKYIRMMIANETFSTELEDILSQSLPFLPQRSFGFKTAPEIPNITSHGTSRNQNDTRIAILPFKTDKTEDRAFTMGLSEDITTAFAKFRQISCLSSSSMSDTTIADWQKMDLDFVLDGIMIRKNDEMIISLRLVNVQRLGELKWRHRIRSKFSDIRNLKNIIASATVAQVVPEIWVWEGREELLGQVHATAYELMLRAIPCITHLDGTFSNAKSLLERSIELDPNNAACYSWLALWYLFVVGEGKSSSPPDDIKQAELFAQKSIQLDPDDGRAYAVFGHITAFLYKDPQTAFKLHTRAVTLNPNLAIAWCWFGIAKAYEGNHKEAVPLFERSFSLSPFDPQMYFMETCLGFSLVRIGRITEGLKMVRSACNRNPNFSSSHKLFLVLLGHHGEQAETSKIKHQLLTLEPHFTVRQSIDRSPLRDADDLAYWEKGLILAGLPMG